ncbi:AAA family ATPase [Candidatus Latescibacterota bacterium]
MHLKKVTIHPEKFPANDCYPFNLSVFHNTDSISLNAPVTCFVGENGTGKTTLLKAICTACGTHIWADESRSRFEKNHWEDELYRAVSVVWTEGKVAGSYFGSDIFRYFVSMLDEWAVADPGMLEYFGGKSLMTQSHGQSLMSFFRNRYKIKGIYFLDEPETALSPKSQLELLKLQTDMSRDGHAQFIMATHSPILMACPGAEILSFNSDTIKRIAYEETDHYRVYRDFLTDREQYLNELKV